MFFPIHEPSSPSFVGSQFALADLFKTSGRPRHPKRADWQALAMDDRTLNDIGLPRARVLAMVYGPKPKRRVRHASA